MGLSTDGKTFVAIKFGMDGGRPSVLEYAFYRGSKLVEKGEVALDAAFESVFSVWQAKFPPEACLHGRLPVIVGWGVRTCEIIDSLLEGAGEISSVDRMVSYFDVEAYARRKIRDVSASDRWPQIVRKIQRLDKAYWKMREPSPQACAEMMLALDRPDVNLVIAKAFKKFLEVIMADGKITTDEAKGLRSFVNILVCEYPQFHDLELELDDVLEDDVVTKSESKRLMKTLDEMRQYYETFIASKENGNG